MTARNLFSRYFKIEYLLIFISTLSLASTIFFKHVESKNFDRLLNKAEDCITMHQHNDSDIKESTQELRNAFIAFTYYNEEIDNIIENFIKLLEDKDHNHSEDELATSLMTLQKEMYLNQRHLDFGYEFLLFVSFFIILVAICVIIHKSFIQKNELTLTKILNENQIKFSREIHDGVAQDLAALKMCLENDNSTRARIFADQAFNEVRFLIETTHMNLSDNFESILSETIKSFETNFSIKAELFMASSNIHTVSDANKMELLRILNEALSNIARHSKATKATVKITDYGEGFRFIISDNGIGITGSNKSPANGKNERQHFGIENIKARVHEMKGTVDFIFEGGTTIAITVKDIVS